MLLICATVGFFSCGRWVSNDTYVGVKEIMLPDGSRVYLRREVRGRNYDILGLSATGDVCRKLNERTDYIYPEMGPLTVYYAESEGALVLYSTSELKEPTRWPGGTRVVNHILNPIEFKALEDHYIDRGLVKATVPVKATTCR
jgi:hypothetical protein